MALSIGLSIYGAVKGARRLHHDIVTWNSLMASWPEWTRFNIKTNMVLYLP